MGCFYTTYTLRGPTPQAVAQALDGRSAFVTRSHHECVVVFDEPSEEQDTDVISELARHLSGTLQCPVLAVVSHDDDLLWYQLYLNGELADEYDSAPGYFDPDANATDPQGGDATKLCNAFGSSHFDEVERILRTANFAKDGYPFAIERHADLAKALGLPSFSVGANFFVISNGEYPEGLSADDLIEVS